MSTLVSILIPCYNAAPWLAATLDSALAQTHSGIEIIVVDDGSTDDSLRIAQGYSDPRLKVVRQPNAGQCAAFNHALRLAQGDYVEFLDADDLLHSEKIATQLARLATLPPGRIASGEWARFHESPSEAVFTPEPVWRDLDPVDWLVTSWNGGGMMHGAAWLAPRTVVEAAGPWDERLTLINDLDFFTRLLLASSAVAFCPGARSYYRSGLPGSLSARTSPQAWRSAFLATELSSANLIRREASARVRQAVADSYTRLAHSMYPDCPDLVARCESVAREHGGSTLRPGGGPAFQTLLRLLGWKPARRLQRMGRALFR